MKVYGVACTTENSNQEKLSFDRDKLVVENLVPVCKHALKEANTLAKNIDLILTVGINIHKMASNDNFVGPRYGHPLQNELKATKAHSIDLPDSDWSVVLEVAYGFCRNMGYKRVLITRCENSDEHIMPCEQSGFQILNGAAALVVGLDPFDTNTKWDHQKVYLKGQSLKIKKWKEIFEEGKAKYRFEFPVDLSFKNDFMTSIKSLSSAEVDLVTESLNFENGIYYNPFDLPLSLVELKKEKKKKRVNSISFNPFKQRISRLSLSL